MAASTNGLMPVITPPSPGLDVHANSGPKIIAVSIALIVIAALAVILRFVSRMSSKAGLWWDDWTILLAMVSAGGENPNRRDSSGGSKLRNLIVGVVGSLHMYDSLSVCPGLRRWRGSISAEPSIAATRYGFGRHMEDLGGLGYRLEAAHDWFILL